MLFLQKKIGAPMSTKRVILHQLSKLVRMFRWIFLQQTQVRYILYKLFPIESGALLWVHVSQADGRLLTQDVQALEIIWFTLDQLAGNCFKAILHGNGYLRGPNRGLSQKVVVLVIKEDWRQSQDIASRMVAGSNLVAGKFFGVEIFVQATFDASVLFH